MDMDLWKIADGVYLTDNAPGILVESEAKLAALAGSQPGTVAHTAGCRKMWELDVDGITWVPFGKDAEDAEP